MLAEKTQGFFGDTLHVVDRAVKFEALQTFGYPVTHSTESM